MRDKFHYAGKDKKFAARFAGGGAVPITGSITIGSDGTNTSLPTATSGAQSPVINAGTFSSPAATPTGNGSGSGSGKAARAGRDLNYGVPQNTRAGQIATSMGAPYTSTASQLQQSGFAGDVLGAGSRTGLGYAQ